MAAVAEESEEGAVVRPNCRQTKKSFDEENCNHSEVTHWLADSFDPSPAMKKRNNEGRIAKDRVLHSNADSSFLTCSKHAVRPTSSLERDMYSPDTRTWIRTDGWIWRNIDKNSHPIAMEEHVA